MAKRTRILPDKLVAEVIMEAFPRDSDTEYAPETVQSAFEKIEALGPTGYDGITKLLRGGRAKKLLAAIGEPALKYLEYALDQGDKDAQEDAVGILGNIGSPSALEMLESILRSPEYSENLRRSAAYQVGRNGKIETLDKALTDDNEEIRVAASGGLSGMMMGLSPWGQPDASHEPIIALFLRSLNDTNATVRWHAVDNLGRADRLTTEMVDTALNDEDVEVRKRALGALFKIGIDQSTAPMLAKAIEDVSAEISTSAIENIVHYYHKEQIDSKALAKAVIDVLILRTSGLPEESFNPDQVAEALQRAVDLSPPVRGYILAQLCNLAYGHTDSVRTRSILVARRMDAGDFSAQVQERSNEDPSAARTILQLLGVRSETDTIIHQLSEVSPGDVQRVAALQTGLLEGYYRNALDQVKTSFRWAIALTILGFVCLVISLGHLLFTNTQGIVGILTSVSSILSQFIAGAQFYLHREAAKRLASSQFQLHQIQRFQLANNVCESLEGEIKQQTRAELVKLIATLGLNYEELSTATNIHPGPTPQLAE